MAGREIELMNDRDQARERLAIWAGGERPSTIVRKELIDNAIDVVSEKGQKATECTIFISPNHIRVMDNGRGISTKVKEGTDKTHLWLACAKMFSSSNYEGVASTTGANGVGMTVANYTSLEFNIAIFNDDKYGVQGYSFIDGFLTGTDECKENLQQLINTKEFKDNNYDQKYVDKLLRHAEFNGNFIKNPIEKKDALKMWDFVYDLGFMVDVRWPNSPNKIFNSPADINWLINYARDRVGELDDLARVTLIKFDNDNFDPSSINRKYYWTKDKELAESIVENDLDLNGYKTNRLIQEKIPYYWLYVKSWKEKVEEYNAVTVKHGPWIFAFSKNPEMKVNSIVQGAPIESRYEHGCSIEIQDYSITVKVPISIFYNSVEYPPYNDQTKTNIKFPYYPVSKAFENSGDIYKYFYHEAEKAYMAKTIQDSDTNMFWPALGPAEEAELIIAEGYSAITGLKSQRNPLTQACIALRGKISNVWNMDMIKSMRSDIVKQMLNAVLTNNYKRVIIATDADDDGAHICALLIALFYKNTNLIQEGKLYYVESPLFVFKKGNKIVGESQFEKDKPEGAKIHRNKGLGSLTAEEVRKYIMDEDTRTLVQVKDDPHAWESLDLAFTYGAESWIEGIEKLS